MPAFRRSTASLLALSFFASMEPAELSSQPLRLLRAGVLQERKLKISCKPVQRFTFTGWANGESVSAKQHFNND